MYRIHISAFDLYTSIRDISFVEVLKTYDNAIIVDMNAPLVQFAFHSLASIEMHKNRKYYVTVFERLTLHKEQTFALFQTIRRLNSGSDRFLRIETQVHIPCRIVV